MQYEAAEQVKLFRWVQFISAKYPQVGLLFHIPNGGKRNSAEAAHLKKQGVRAGVPDLFLPVASGKYHGLFIELKYSKNKPTQKQTEWLRNLSNQNYAVKVCYGWEDAAETICKYLNIAYN